MSAARTRLLFVTNDLEVGGAQRFLLGLLRALDRDRFAPHCATVAGEGPWVAELRDLGVPHAHVPAVLRRGSWRAIDPRAVLRLARLMAGWRIDVVHSQLFLGNAVGRLAALAAGVPRRIASEHSTYFDHGAWHWRVDRTLARHTERIVAVSDPVARFLVGRGIPAERVTVVPNGIALERFEKLPSRSRARRALGLPEGAIVLGSVARFTSDKRLEAVLDLLPALRARRPGARLLLVGDGPRRAALEARARALGVADAVRFLGERDDVPELLPALDLFVLPSVREGLPTTVLEAMAAGVPPVVQDLAYAREVVEHGRDGLLVDFGDAPRARAALAALAGDPARRAELGARARAGARRFSIRRTAEMLTRLYADGGRP